MLPAKFDRPPHISTDRSGVTRTPIVVVLGMHRSGTSLCSQILSLLGVDMADDVGRGNGNEAGHWERWEIVEFHNRVLRLLDRDYYSGMHDFALPSGWWAQPEVRAIQRELEEFVRTRMRPGYPFGFKDPRTARLLPLWTPIFRALNLNPRFVFCVRSPSQVARSLNDRDGLPLLVGEYRWAVYNTECWRNLRAEACTIVYDSWFEDRDRTLNRLVTFLSDIVDVDSATITQAVDLQIDKSLRHDRPDSEKARQPALRYLYELLSQPNQDGETRVAIGRFVEQFAAFQQILPFERAVKAAAECETVEAAVKEGAQALAEVKAQYAIELAALGAAGDEIRNEAGTVRQEFEALRAQHAAVVQARDKAVAEAERHAAVALGFHQECEALRSQHADAARARDEAVAEAERQAAAAHEARHESEALRAQHAAAAQARDEAVAEAERQAAAAHEARHESEKLRAQQAAAECRAAAVIRRHQDAYADLLKWLASFQDGVTASWSWRLTRPLRRMGIARAVLPPPPAPAQLESVRQDGDAT